MTKIDLAQEEFENDAYVEDMEYKFRTKMDDAQYRYRKELYSLGEKLKKEQTKLDYTQYDIHELNKENSDLKKDLSYEKQRKRF